MSKTPIRHALLALQQEGLLELGPRRQLLVCGLPSARRTELREVREALEGLAMSYACREISDDDLDHLRTLLRRQRRAAEAGREDEFIELDEELHLTLAVAGRAGAGAARAAPAARVRAPDAAQHAPRPRLYAARPGRARAHRRRRGSPRREPPCPRCASTSTPANTSLRPNLQGAPWAEAPHGGACPPGQFGDPAAGGTRHDAGLLTRERAQRSGQPFSV